MRLLFVFLSVIVLLFFVVAVFFCLFFRVSFHYGFILSRSDLR